MLNLGKWRYLTAALLVVLFVVIIAAPVAIIVWAVAAAVLSAVQHEGAEFHRPGQFQGPCSTPIFCAAR